MTKLAIVLPCYNEEEVLSASVAHLDRLFRRLVDDGNITPDSYMLFVNDGSRDETWSVISCLHKENSRVHGLNLSRNVGHQSAIMAGMMTARHTADVVITIDADLQDDLNAVPRMLAEYEQGHDIVYGVKVSRTADPLLKRMSALAFYRLQAKMGVESVFNHADFRLMSRKALDMLAEYGERNLYLRGLIPLIGLRSATVDDIISERTAGVSKYTLGKMASLALDGITSFSIKPIYGILYMGVFFIIISFIISIYVVHAFVAGTAVPGWSSLILSIWLVGGFLMVAVGTVGVYIGKIYREVKGRPLYHIQEILE